MRRLFLLLKNIVMAPFLIYLYNLVANPLGYVVPINFFTIVFVGILGVPGLLMLILLLVVVFK